MNTPNLDALIQLSLSQCASVHDFHKKREQLERIFWAHGPALVAVLKKVSDMECCCGDDSMERCSACQSKTVLVHIDQEATCQK